MCIKPLTKADAFWYLHLYQQCFGKPDVWLAHLDGARYQGYQIIQKAFLIIHVVDKTIDILTIGVDFHYRRQGLAKNLLRNMYKNFSAEYSYFLEVSGKNNKAIDLYKKMGFQEISSRKNYYGKKDDAIVMALSAEFKSI